MVIGAGFLAGQNERRLGSDRGQLQVRGQRGFREYRFHAELHPQRPRRHVVGSFGRRIGRTMHFRIRLLFEQVLGVAREHLRERDHVRPGRVGLAILHEIALGALDFHAAEHQFLDQFAHFVAIVLALERNQNREALSLYSRSRARPFSRDRSWRR